LKFFPLNEIIVHEAEYKNLRQSANNPIPMVQANAGKFSKDRVIFF
jgi:hypothetical protein